jgi:diguanylate cyclase (GGDEF)-like protein
MARIAIIGAGRGGLSLLKVLKQNDDIEIVGICDIDSGAAALAEAVNLGIKTYSNYLDLINDCTGLDLIINVTADPDLPAQLESARGPKTEVIHGTTAELVWELITTQRRMISEVEERMRELKDLYQLGLKLSSSIDLAEVYDYVIEYATRLTKTPAGSIVLLDEEHGEMVLAHSVGFSEAFKEVVRWRFRPHGLTNHILNQSEPVIIPDVAEIKDGISPALAAEKVKSIIATPLTARGKVMGILYVDDFEERDFSAGEASILGLLSGYAALSIERMKLLEDTRKMAITDGLTGLRNQQEFLAQLDAETDRAERYERKLSVVDLDIDFFKTYNDEFGHLAGNDLLRVLARTISENSRNTDICARIGGEEFAVIMPETTVEDAAVSAERLRATIEKMHVDHADIVKKAITVSIGVATYPEHGESAKEVYKSSDDALYKAKETGRNRVIVFPDTPAPLIDNKVGAS